jgi:hypothetical protein
MKITCLSNSTLSLLMEPETPIESAFLAEMAAQSEKGSTTVLAAPARADSLIYTLVVGGKP